MPEAQLRCPARVTTRDGVRDGCPSRAGRDARLAPRASRLAQAAIGVDARVDQLHGLSDPLGGAGAGERVNTPTVELAHGVPAAVAILVNRIQLGVGRESRLALDPGVSGPQVVASGSAWPCRSRRRERETRKPQARPPEQQCAAAPTAPRPQTATRPEHGYPPAHSANRPPRIDPARRSGPDAGHPETRRDRRLIRVGCFNTATYAAHNKPPARRRGRRSVRTPARPRPPRRCPSHSVPAVSLRTSRPPPR
jgi:hypothetical protein